jgi:hypothetical protein
MEIGLKHLRDERKVEGLAEMFALPFLRDGGNYPIGQSGDHE